MRWMVVVIAGLALALLYLGTVVAFSSSLTGGDPSSTSGPDAPAAALAVAPTPPADLPSKLPPPVSLGSATAPKDTPLAFPPVSPSKEGSPRRASRWMSKMNARQFKARMDALGARLERCPDRYAQGGFGGSEGQGHHPGELTMLMLEIATLDGKVEIVDVPLESNGSVSAGLVACARQMLRGQVIAAPVVKTGGRIPYTLFLGPAAVEPQGQP